MLRILHGEEEQAPTTRLNNNTKEKRRKKHTKATKTDLKRHGLGLISSSDELLEFPTTMLDMYTDTV